MVHKINNYCINGPVRINRLATASATETGDNIYNDQK
jgi:hypothetical protein